MNVFASQSELPARTALIIASVVFFLSAQACFAQSFDCTKSQDAASRLICSDAALMRLDKKLGTVFQRALAEATYDRKSFIADQRGWIKERDSLCGVASKEPLPDSKTREAIRCLTDALNDRLRSLNNNLGSGSPTADCSNILLIDKESDADFCIRKTLQGR